MTLTPIAKAECVELEGVKGKVRVKASLIVSVTAGPPSRVELLGGSAMLVKDSPEEIAAKLAAGGRKLRPGAACYAKLKEAMDSGELAEFVSGDDGKALWIEALKAVSYGKPRSKFSRLAGIYGEALSPFNFVRIFSRDFKSEAPSPLEAEMRAKGFAREDSKGKGS